MILGQNAKSFNCVFSIENERNGLRQKYRKMIDNNNQRSTIAHFQIENLRLYRSYVQYAQKLYSDIYILGIDAF
jgi:hypothetical protein